MPSIPTPQLPKFDTTSLSKDLANKIQMPEIPAQSDGSGDLINGQNRNLGSLLKQKSVLFSNNVEGGLDQFGQNIEGQVNQKAAEVEAAAKKLANDAEAAAKMIQDEFKKKKEEAKKAIEDAKKEAKEVYQKALTAKEKVEDAIAKLRGYKIPRLKKLKPIPTKDLLPPPQIAKYMDASAIKEYSQNVKSAATKGEPPTPSFV